MADIVGILKMDREALKTARNAHPLESLAFMVSVAILSGLLLSFEMWLKGGKISFVTIPFEVLTIFASQIIDAVGLWIALAGVRGENRFGVAFNIAMYISVYHLIKSFINLLSAAFFPIKLLSSPVSFIYVFILASKIIGSENGEKASAAALLGFLIAGAIRLLLFGVFVASFLAAFSMA